MTEEEAKALGRRAVACKGFRPMRGMRDFDGRTWTGDLLWRWTDGVDLPDLRDPATLGCLLALVREKWEDDRVHVVFWHDEDGGWTVCVPEEDVSVNVSEGETEAEAIVAALENAP